jgi:hypothetical protein
MTRVPEVGSDNGVDSSGAVGYGRFMGGKTVDALFAEIDDARPNR